MKLLVWQWGRRGAGPRYAAWLAQAMREVAPDGVALSLSMQAELMEAADAPICELPVPTYRGAGGFVLQWPLAPLRSAGLARRIAALRVDVALCAMPGPLDLVMAAALRRTGVPFAVVVHDADVHPGDGLPLQMRLQRALVRRADALVALSGHVAERLAAQGLVAGRPLIRSRLPPFTYGALPPPPRAHGGKLRLLSFGRLLPYKGLDLLADAVRALGGRDDFELRVVGQGQESAVLADLRGLPGVAVENRWVPEAEIAALLGWADALVLSHREASQSGAAAAAIAARRFVVATDVGGLGEQLRDEPLARLCPLTADALAAAIADLIATPVDAEGIGLDAAAAWRDVATTLRRDLMPLVREGRATR
ncbi:MAG TPA: glycosyltransferase [Acetobacteraceae bacterium]|nr:glycosyltransferase [Acetobacteraceae bacterium]